MNIIEIINLGLLLVVIVLLTKKQGLPSPINKTSSKDWVVDSCTLIDGRILEIIKLGFSGVRLLVPNMVVRELQTLADGSDSYKRSRARHGLDVLAEIKQLDNVELEIVDETPPKGNKVDDFLVDFTKALKAKLVTLDFNLIKVAKVSGVETLNINDLSQKLRPVILPGEKTRVTIVQKGSNKDQGVGYLEDGTMIVVDNASKMINKSIEVEVNRYLQTEAGKMIFASLVKQSPKK